MLNMNDKRPEGRRKKCKLKKKIRENLFPDLEQNSLTFPWFFPDLQNSLTFPWLENALPFFPDFPWFSLIVDTLYIRTTLTLYILKWDIRGWIPRGKHNWNP